MESGPAITTPPELEPPPLPLHPPTAPGPTPVRPPAWPTVLGVIALVFGCLGLFGSLWGAASGLWFQQFGLSGTPDMRAMFDAMRPWQDRIAIVSGVGAPVALLLLAAGIGLLQRQRWSRPAALVWAILKVFLSLVLAVLAYFMQRAQFEAMGQMTSAKGAGPMPAAFGPTLAAVTLVLTIAWGWALPAFMLFWFSRPSIRSQVAAWRSPARVPYPRTILQA